MRQGRPDFLLNRLVPFAEEQAAFRMADDYIATAQFAQHRRGHLPGEGTLLFPMEVLGPEADP